MTAIELFVMVPDTQFFKASDKGTCSILNVVLVAAAHVNIEQFQRCKLGCMRLKQLERENRELKRANEILRKASAYFAQAELDRRHK